MRVLHLVGSAVSDFYADLSRLYAADCLTAVADPARYEMHVAYVTPDGRWRFPVGAEPLSDAALAAAEPMPVDRAVARLVELAPDVAVPQLFCLPGMTHYRALLDLLGIRYVGNRPDVMALGADKAKAKAVVASAGVRVPSGDVLRPRELPTVTPPAVVKPADADNSLGITLVRRTEEYAAALMTAFEHADRVLVEEFVPLGREVRCGVLERGDELVCLPLEEYNVDADERPIRGYADKIARTDGGGLQLMAKEATRAWIVDPADPVTAAVHEAARRCHVAMGARHYSLFDFRIDPAGEPVFLEAGLYCSFARTSVIAVMAQAAGIALPELFSDAVTAAVTGQPSAG